MAALYGCNAYTGTNPIGGLVGGGDGLVGTPKYVSPYGFNADNADYVVDTLSELTSALAAAGDGKVIWIPGTATITIPTMNIGTLKSGAILASDRGTSGSQGALLNWTYQNSGSMMSPIRAASGSIFSGLRIKGPRAYHSTAASPAGKNIAIMTTVGAEATEVENCELYDTSMMGIYYYGSGDHTWHGASMHWVHHCYIHGHQRWGFGYGTAQEHGCFVRIECNLFVDNRHHVMGQAASTTGAITDYEVRYNYFGDARYGKDGPTNYNHQVDMHGGSNYSGDRCEVHHNTFTANDGKANVGQRGKAKTTFKVYNNWTKKTVRKSPPAYDETAANSAFSPLASGGSATSDTPASRNMTITDNWYGTTAPSGGSGSAQVDTNPATGIYTTGAYLNGSVVSMGSDTTLSVSFEYGETTSYGSKTSANVVASPGSILKAPISLDAGTTYHFRIKAVGAVSGTVYGPDRAFTTLSSADGPTVATGTAQNVADTTSTINGTLSDLGTAETVQVYFEWGLTTSYGSQTNNQPRSTTGDFSASLTGLSPGTVYHYRAVAVGDGTDYGDDATFTTAGVEPDIPWCITMPATGITHEVATLHATVTGLSSNHPVVKRGFKWGTVSGEYTDNWSEEGEWDDGMSYAYQLTGLTPETTYYFCGFIETEE